ncbi:hypothetical protein BS47DRAFT_1374450 [Hydnum rufescens UP504]|uniref:Uncharacterized protein n=1 Tax=Hydnum rufescens UP504 TaxID=1448309 RepID=A0A9P6ADZ5_9AGAM|nr:hypothetical protein BS47DRAFT_1374450 [Hydnum rufescens UP504]
MATLLPPPKQLPDTSTLDAKSAPTVVVQFVSQDDGEMLLGPAVNVPADFSHEGLEALANKQSGQMTHSGAPTHLIMSTSLLQEVLCSPQSVFCVHPATHCSSTLMVHGASILCAAFLSTGHLLATGSGDTTAHLLDLNMELPSHTLARHKGWMLCVEWEAREWKLVTSGHDGQVCIWNPKSGKPLGNALKGHTMWITSLAWGPIHINAKNPQVASSSKDNTSRNYWGSCLGGDHSVRVWDTDNGKVVYILKDHAHWVTTLALNTDFILRTRPYDHTGKVPTSDEEALTLALVRYESITASTPELLISSSDDHTLFLWSVFRVETAMGLPKPSARLTGHQRQVSCVGFSPYGQWAASAGFNNCLRVWGGYIARLQGHVMPVYRLTWSADSRLLVSVSKDHTVKLALQGLRRGWRGTPPTPISSLEELASKKVAGLARLLCGVGKYANPTE